MLLEGKGSETDENNANACESRSSVRFSIDVNDDREPAAMIAGEDFDGDRIIRDTVFRAFNQLITHSFSYLVTSSMNGLMAYALNRNCPSSCCFQAQIIASPEKDSEDIGDACDRCVSYCI